MTKKHFEAIANDINKKTIEIKECDFPYDEKWFALLTLEDLVHELTITFSEFNSNFDADKFIRATGIVNLSLTLKLEKA
jgi:hypothetical protein|tara:strand:- start:407 stop:643 length:237 start_codon:yes stop_codon:yes gene_type:complete